MIIRTTKTIETQAIKDVLCNKCGLSTDNGMNREFMDCHNNWGYGTNKDGESEEAHICEKCWDEFSSTFKLPSTIKDYMGY